MLFSELYSVIKSQDEIWFDPILDVDTKLFIDPFLLLVLQKNTLKMHILK